MKCLNLPVLSKLNHAYRRVTQNLLLRSFIFTGRGGIFR